MIDPDQALHAEGGASAAPRLVSVQVVADLLGCDRRKVHRLAIEGRIPYYVVGSARKFIVAEVLAAIHRPAEARPTMAKRKSQGRHMRIEAMRR